ncbi:MAG: hypothetical protein HYV65_00305 [Candidatus Spechtbacteria bacterium]|nr:hypothetical protein [Candidatus Spechtbacteria bacterium]
MVEIILLFIFGILWITSVVKDALFWIYLWQLKEYRLDRMRAHFELPSAKKLLLSYKTLAVGVLFLFSALGLLASFFSYVMLLAGIGLYGFQAYRMYEAYQDHRLRMPTFTKKAVSLLGLTFSSALVMVIAGLLSPLPSALSLLFFTDLMVPAIATAFVGTARPLSLYMKRKIVARAKTKLASTPDLLVIGITGSFGKTSMKEFLSHILENNFNVLKTPENTNTEIGIASHIIKNLRQEHEIFIVEMGAYKRGEIRDICAMVKPQIGILTGINQQHLSLFGSFRNIQRAKYELIESLPEKGLAIFNGDNQYTRALYDNCKKPKRLYATNLPEGLASAAIFAQKIHQGKDRMTVEIRDKKKKIAIEVPLSGAHNGTNVVGAICAAHGLGMSYKEIAEACKTLETPPHAIHFRRGIKHTTIIDDSYSANTDGVFAALDILKESEGRKKICIIYPLIELGRAAEDAHRAIGAKIAETCDQCIVTAPDFYEYIKDEAIKAGMSKNALWCIPDPYIAMRKAQELCDEGDVILLENRVPETIVRNLIIDD